MGRPKLTHRNLPVRMRFSHNAWYHVVGNKWTLLGHTYADALLAYAKIEAARSERRDVNALLDAFLHYQAHRKDGRKLSPNTLASYRHHARKHGHLRRVFGAVMPAAITVADGRTYLDRHPKYSTARHELGVLSAALSYGAERGWIVVNPWLNWRKGAMAKRQRLITKMEWDAILAEAPELAEPLRFLHFTALRVRDALALRWSHLKPDGLRVAIAKSKAVTVYDRTPALEERLRALRTASVVSLSLMTVDGRPLTYPVLYKRYKRACKAVGCPDVTLHDIRRMRLTEVERERGIAFAQALAAHTDPKVTRGYVVSQPRVAI